MFCKHCGQDIADEAVYCIKCGRPVEPKTFHEYQAKKVIKPFSASEMVGWIGLSILVPIVGIIVGLCNLKPDRTGQGVTMLLLSIIAWVVYIAIVF